MESSEVGKILADVEFVAEFVEPWVEAIVMEPSELGFVS